jgi:hypothetical protein
MKPINKFYLELFLKTGLPFGIFLTVFDMIIGEDFSIWAFLFSTIFFGLLMSISFVSMQKIGLKKLGITEFNESNLKPFQEKEIISTLSRDEIINRLETEKWNGKIVVSKDRSAVVINSRASWRSWGEKIMVEMKDGENNQTQIKITSKPNLSLTFVDYGKNLENIKLVEHTLQN